MVFVGGVEILTTLLYSENFEFQMRDNGEKLLPAMVYLMNNICAIVDFYFIQKLTLLLKRMILCGGDFILL